MLRSLIAYLTTPCPRYVRRMGYLTEAIAMRERYRRCQGSWLPHLQNTKEVVAAAAVSCCNRGKVIVLGSGLLLDLPLEMLAERFKEVVLVDIVHLPDVRGCTRRYRNVKVVQCDITGIAEQLFQGRRTGTPELPRTTTVIPEMDNRTGLVISLNILSQLAVVPSRFVYAKMPGVEDRTVTSWCDEVRRTHYSSLRALTCDVCLVADYRYVLRGKKGDVVGEGSTVESLSLPEPASSWTWELAPRREISRHYAKELLVGAWHMPG